MPQEPGAAFKVAAISAIVAPCRIPSATPLPVCCVLLQRDDNRVLVAQRPPGKHLAFQWEFPGGKIEPGEDSAAALHREIREELGCSLTLVAPLPPCRHTYPDLAIELHPWVAQLAADSPAPHPREHLALRWVTDAEFAALDLAAADLPVLAAYRAWRPGA